MHINIVSCALVGALLLTCPIRPALAQDTTLVAQPVSPERIRFIHSGGNDCPPCVVWRNLELPKLEKSANFQAIKFSYVGKAIRSSFPPSEFFLPPELKPLRDKLHAASGGRNGSPQQVFMVDGEVREYHRGGPLDAAEIEARIAALTRGTKYPSSGSARPESDATVLCLQCETGK